MRPGGRQGSLGAGAQDAPSIHKSGLAPAPPLWLRPSFSEAEQGGPRTCEGGCGALETPGRGGGSSFISPPNIGGPTPWAGPPCTSGAVRGCRVGRRGAAL